MSEVPRVLADSNDALGNQCAPQANLVIILSIAC